MKRVVPEGTRVKNSYEYYDLLVALSHAKQKVFEIEQLIEELMEEKSGIKGREEWLMR